MPDDPLRPPPSARSSPDQSAVAAGSRDAAETAAPAPASAEAVAFPSVGPVRVPEDAAFASTESSSGSSVAADAVLRATVASESLVVHEERVEDGERAQVDDRPAVARGSAPAPAAVVASVLAAGLAAREGQVGEDEHARLLHEEVTQAGTLGPQDGPGGRAPSAQEDRSPDHEGRRTLGRVADPGETDRLVGHGERELDRVLAGLAGRTVAGGRIGVEVRVGDGLPQGAETVSRRRDVEGSVDEEDRGEGGSRRRDRQREREQDRRGEECDVACHASKTSETKFSSHPRSIFGAGVIRCRNLRRERPVVEGPRPIRGRSGDAS